jgi:high-affinity iron transporter
MVCGVLSLRRLSLHRRPPALAVVVAIIVLATAAVVVGIAAPSAPDTKKAVALPASSEALVVTADRCASGWKTRTPGYVVFRIVDRTDRPGRIYLFNPYTGVTVGQTVLQADTTAKLPVHLKIGRYRWKCQLKGQPVRTSSLANVGPAPVQTSAGPTFYIPVTGRQMTGAISAYRAYVEQKLTLESTQVQFLGTAIAGGQLTAARSAWLTAYLTWRRIGGAYDAFGELGTSIDGTAAGLLDGVLSPQYTGFHKVEADLWQNSSLTAAAADGATLLANVNELEVKFPNQSIPATELPLRTHEILEDALRDELSGADDYGSGTDMAAVEADVDGTRELLALEAPLLKQRAPDLVATVMAQLNRLDVALSATQVSGQWVAVTQVPLAQRDQVDSAIGVALENLDLAPELLHVVGSST